MKKQELRVKVIVPSIKYSESFKRAVVKEYESGILNKDQEEILALKY